MPHTACRQINLATHTRALSELSTYNIHFGSFVLPHFETPQNAVRHRVKFIAVKNSQQQRPTETRRHCTQRSSRFVSCRRVLWPFNKFSGVHRQSSLLSRAEVHDMHALDRNVLPYFERCATTRRTNSRCWKFACACALADFTATFCTRLRHRMRIFSVDLRNT